VIIAFTSKSHPVPAGTLEPVAERNDSQEITEEIEAFLFYR